MSETKDAVDRLRWLCEEASKRAEEEFETDFTKGLFPLQIEMGKLVPELFEAGILNFRDSIPFKVKVERIPPTDERYVHCSEIKSVTTLEPLESGLCERILSSANWLDRDAGIVSAKYFGADELRKWFCQRMRHWVRFLEAESLRLESPCGDSATSTGETEVPSKHPRKRTNGRPVEYNLNKTQLSAIEKRLKKGETVRSIWQQYKKGIPVEATFRRKIAHIVPKIPKQH